MLASTSFSMPAPSSETVRSKYCPGVEPACSRQYASSIVRFAVLMTIPPTPAIASRALTQRLVTICSSWDGSILIGHGLASGCQVTCTSSPSRRGSILSISATVAFTSTTLGATVCLRAKAAAVWWNPRSAPAALSDLDEVLVNRVRRVHRFERQRSVADDHAQHVVEVVRHAPGETTHGLHLRRLVKVGFELGLLQLQALALGHDREGMR